jgi:hypothetical protein
MLTFPDALVESVNLICNAVQILVLAWLASRIKNGT